MSIPVLLYYKLIPLSNLDQIMAEQRQLCEGLGLKGRILISTEGINGTVAGERDSIEKYKEFMWSNANFSGTIFKESLSDTNPFPKLKVKVRSEIISLYAKVDLTNRAPYISPTELHNLYESGEEFYIIDTRNTYESVEGTFEGSIAPDMNHFRELPKKVKDLADLKNKKVVTFCTGGIRCEKAATYLKQKGFEDVYQLEGGIVNYIMQYPEKYFKGDCYVFDDRMRLTQDEIAKHGVISPDPQFQAQLS